MGHLGLNLTLLTFSLNCFITFFRNCTWWQILWIQENWQFWIFKEKSYLTCLNQRSGYFLGSKSTLLNFSLDLLINCIFLKLYLMTGLMRWSECSRFLRNILYIPQNSVNGTCFCPKSLLLIFSINLFTSYFSEIFKRTSYPRSKTIIKDVKLTDTRTTWYLVLSDCLGCWRNTHVLPWMRKKGINSLRPVHFWKFFVFTLLFGAGQKAFWRPEGMAKKCENKK